MATWMEFQGGAQLPVVQNGELPTDAELVRLATGDTDAPTTMVRLLWNSDRSGVVGIVHDAGVLLDLEPSVYLAPDIYLGGYLIRGPMVMIGVTPSGENRGLRPAEIAAFEFAMVELTLGEKVWRGPGIFRVKGWRPGDPIPRTWAEARP